MMKVVTGVMKHCSSVEIFSRESPWKHSFNGRLTVTMSHIFIINENAPRLITLGQIPTSALFPIVISLVLCVKYNKCVHLGR